jgi:GxxExxY protein
MKRSLEFLNPLSNRIIGCAIEVHRQLGPGLLESVYENALCVELKNTGISFEQQKEMAVDYKGNSVGSFRIDILVENAIVLELKSIERHDPIFEAQLLSYMKLGKFPIGILLNFNNVLLKKGIKRMILQEFLK